MTNCLDILRKVREIETRINRMQDKLDTIVHRIRTLESENYDADKVKSGLRELREYLQENTDFWAYVRLEDSQ